MIHMAITLHLYRRMGKRFLNFAIQVIRTAIIYIALLWLFQMAFDKVSSFDWGWIFQGFLFSIIYVSLTRWDTKRKSNK